METVEQLKILDEYCDLVENEVICKKAYHKRPLGEFKKSESRYGHYTISVKGRCYYLHRVIFYLTYKWMPKLIDHIDRNPKNNFIDNLRAATKATNSWNRDVQGNSTTKVRGVHYNKNPDSVRKWCSYIKVNGVRMWLGSFETCEDASKAYKQALDKYASSGEITL